MKKESGFGAVPALLVLAVFGIIGGTGWYVWQQKRAAQPAANTAITPAASEPQVEPEEAMKEYRNTDYGFSFSYPASWTISEEFEDIGRGGPEGAVTVTSPNGTILSFRGNFGGKGGSCEPDPADKPHDTKNCSTLEVINVKEIAQPSATYRYPIYLVRSRFTPARANNERSRYALFATSGPNAISKPGITIDAEMDFGLIRHKGYIEVHVTGGDQKTASYFDSVNAKEATKVLETFRIF